MKYQSRALLALMAILAIFLIVGSLLVILQQQRLLRESAREHVGHEAHLISSAATDSLIRRDYVTVQNIIMTWGGRVEDIVQARAVTPNGFVLASYERASKPGNGTYDFRERLEYEGRLLMDLEVTADYSSTDDILGDLYFRLVSGSILLMVTMGIALWYTQRKIALLPMEQEISRRRKAELELTQTRDELEVRVEERTVELKEELEERKRMEEELLKREERIRLLLESTAEAIYGVDVEGLCTFVNPACLKLLGFECEEALLGKNMHDLIHHTRPDGSPYPEKECKAYEAYKGEHGIHVKDEVFWRADGSKFDVEYYSYPIIDRDKVVGAVITFLDVSEQRKLEAQLRQSQKMEAIGTLTGGIAHDFNNILTAIMGFGEFLLDEAEKGSPRRMYVDLILASAQRASNLTQGLLAFSRKQQSNPVPLELNSLVDNILKMLQTLVGEDVNLIVNLNQETLMVMADEGQLQQVLINLCANARDAMPGGGTINIGTKQVTIEEDFIRTMGYGSPGSYSVLEVSDNGKGMDKKTVERIFEPFFTTKKRGKGTGLGLSIVYGIVRDHNGFINVYSEPGKGTAFKVYLPSITAEERVAVSETIYEVPRGNETVFVAEDDDPIRKLVRMSLERAGYVVIEAADGEEGLNVFNEHKDEIDLLLLDVVMPKMDGKALLEEIRKVRPQIKVLFTSGYPSDIIEQRGMGGEGLEYIQKPVSPTTLLRKVREALDRK